MAITQHLHISNFHTSNFNFGEKYLKFISIQPLTQDKQVAKKGTMLSNQVGEDTTRGGGRRTQRKAIRRQMTQQEGGTDNVGGWRLLVAAADNKAWYRQGGWQRRSRVACGCQWGGWMQPVAAGEDGKVGGSGRGNKYFTLIFHGHVWGLHARPVCSMCRVFTRKLLLSFHILKNTLDYFVLTEYKNLHEWRLFMSWLWLITILVGM